MTLDMFHEEKNIEAKPKVEWNGIDFRGEKCKPQSINFLRQHPKVYNWLESKSRKYIDTAVCYLIQFFEWAKMTPEQWLSLNEKEARDIAWEYIRTIRMEHPAKARIFKGFVKVLYLYQNEKALPFIPSKHRIEYEPKRIKHIMNKEVCWKIINKAKNIRDGTILTFAFESGLRRNAMVHMTFGHYKNFMWFKKDGDTVVPSTPEDSNIAIFKVRATPSLEYTHDNKLRGKGINWYYGCLHKEATEILKEYVAKYHQKSKEDTAFWYSLNPRWYEVNKDKGLDEVTFWDTLKRCVKRAGLPVKQISFHALRRGFRHVVRNTGTITDAEFKEAIMGHKLRGSQEAYFDKPVIEFAREYAKCDFSSPVPEKDKEIERLRKQVAKYEEAIEEAGATTKIKIEQLPLAYRTLEEQSTPEPSKIEPRSLPKPSETMPVLEPQPQATKPIGHSTFASLKEKPSDYVTCQADGKAYKLLELPCMVNPLLNCPNKLCEKEVMKLIK